MEVCSKLNALLDYGIHNAQMKSLVKVGFRIASLLFPTFEI